MSSDDTRTLGGHAQEYAHQGWEVFPLVGKIPALRNPHPRNFACKGECGQDGHGIWDATTDPGKIAAWWKSNPYYNIGLRPHPNVFVLDMDPRHQGHITLRDLINANGEWPSECFGAISGRGDGGRHWYMRHPGGTLTTAGLPGLDVKTHSGYVVAPPSIHPDSGKPYERIDGPIGIPPAWLVAALRPKQSEPQRREFRRHIGEINPGSSPADRFCAATSWAEILMPHGWACLDADPDADGARWLHPNATSKLSATVRHEMLFVYTTSTVLPITEAGNPKGLTRFRAHALLNHGGDLRAAAATLLVNGSL